MMKWTVRDPVDPRRVASYDPKLRVLMNQEGYLFADKNTRKKFLADPLRYSGPLTDPVSQNRFQPTRFSPHTKYGERIFYFESNLTRRQFAVSPKQYAVRREL
jgi:YHS domain-containing protein